MQEYKRLQDLREEDVCIRGNGWEASHGGMVTCERSMLPGCLRGGRPNVSAGPTTRAPIGCPWRGSFRRPPVHTSSASHRQHIGTPFLQTAGTNDLPGLMIV